MKNSLISSNVSLIILTILFMMSCSSKSEKQLEYTYKVTPELKTKIEKGIKQTPRSQQKEFEKLYTNIIEVCSQESMQDMTNPYEYLKLDQYKQFKSFFEQSPSTHIYYLLIDKFLICEHTVVLFMFNDIVSSTYPEVIEEVVKTLKDLSIEENMANYPIICTEKLISKIETNDNK